MKMAWKLENMRKDPNSKESYADLFISQIKEEPKTVCLFAIGDARAVEIILENYKNTQFVVFDYPALIKFLDFAKPANLFKAIPIKYDWESESEFLGFVEAEMQKTSKEIEGTNMSFDLIIANPPYGKSSSLSKKIVNTLLENKVAKEMVVLAPPKTFWGLLPHLDSFHIVGNISGLFDMASKESGDLLSCGLVKEEKIKDPKYTHQYDLAQITDKQRQLMKAVEEYNSTHEPFYAELMRQMTLNNKKFYPNVNEDLIFTVPIYTPHDKVHANDSADRRHNIERKPVEWKDSSSCDYGILFKDNISYKNFCNWWYKVPGMYGESEKTFLWNSLEVLLKCFGGGPSINKYPLTFPNLDWSHPWADEEILKEIGLPEDFLEE